MTNKIFALALNRPTAGMCDYYDGFVVIATDAMAARALITNCADECDHDRQHGEIDTHLCVWRDPSQTGCEEIGTASEYSKPEIVLGSFNAG